MAEPKKEKKPKPKPIKVIRHFGYKLGRPNYSSADFFCSVEQEVPVEEAGLRSGQLDKFAFEEVKLSIAKFLAAEAQKNKKPEVMTAEETRREGIDAMDTQSGQVDPVPEMQQIKI